MHYTLQQMFYQFSTNFGPFLRTDFWKTKENVKSKYKKEIPEKTKLISSTQGGGETGVRFLWKKQNETKYKKLFQRIVYQEQW